MSTYDVDLLERLRERLAEVPGVSEKAMFGGVALLLDGKMCVGVMKGGGLMVRLPVAEGEQALAEPYTREMDVTGRSMKGWVIVDAPGYAADDDLARWVERATAYVRELPAKPTKPVKQVKPSRSAR